MPAGIAAILLGDDRDALVTELRRCYPGIPYRQADATLAPTARHIVARIDDPTVPMQLPLHVVGTAFQQRVWHALRQIPLGTTTTYSQLAQQIGAPQAIRAVAAACAANRHAVIIPCHRVVRSDGSLAGYRWGVQRKEALLHRERHRSTAMHAASWAGSGGRVVQP